MTSSDFCVTRDILCLVTWVVVHQRILLTKFGRNWTFGYGARGLMPEEEEERKKELTLKSSMTSIDLTRHVTFNRSRPYMCMDLRNLLTNSGGHPSFPVRQEAFLVKMTFWPVATILELWQKTCNWLFFLSHQCTYAYQIWWKSDIVLIFSRAKFNDL